MKRIVSLLVSLLLLLGLAACGSSAPAPAPETDGSAESDTVFVVMPVWWGDIPMPMYTFFENNDFSGKTVVVFITHLGSRFGRCVRTVESLLPGAAVTEGLAINQDDVSGAQSAIRERLQALGY